MPHPRSTAPPRAKPRRPPDPPRRHPIRTAEAQRLWWGYSSDNNRKHSIPSIVDYATAIATIRTHADNPDAAWWLDETSQRLGAALSGVRSWRHADNAMRDAFLRGLPPRPWTSPRLIPHPDPLVTAYAELLLDYDACVRAAHATAGYLSRRDLPSNGARHLSRDIRTAIANIPRSAVAVARRLEGSDQPAASP